jgi:hypothetical protein
MKALINPNEEVKHISSYDNQDPIYTAEDLKPIYTAVGKRVCEVAQNDFPVALPLFWIDCNNDVTADSHYYDEATQLILIKPNDVESPALTPFPDEAQPPTTGTQAF